MRLETRFTNGSKNSKKKFVQTLLRMATDHPRGERWLGVGLHADLLPSNKNKDHSLSNKTESSL